MITSLLDAILCVCVCVFKNYLKNKINALKNSLNIGFRPLIMTHVHMQRKKESLQTNIASSTNKMCLPWHLIKWQNNIYSIEL